MALVAYTAVPKELKQVVVEAKCCRVYYVSGLGKDYVGLRERVADAVARGERVCNKSVTNETHIILKTTFTEAGFAKYATLSTDHKHNFAPQLYKKIYNTPRDEQEAYDWKVWHWNGDLPLDDREENGQQLVFSEWFEIGA